MSTDPAAVPSDSGRVGSSGEAVYSGAKGGVIGFTKGLARELIRYGITSNCVSPGPTNTPLLQNAPSKLTDTDALKRAIPARRLAEPSEIMQAVRFFASEENGYVTGQTLSVSGGLTMAYRGLPAPGVARVGSRPTFSRRTPATAPTGGGAQATPSIAGASCGLSCIS